MNVIGVDSMCMITTESTIIILEENCLSSNNVVSKRDQCRQFDRTLTWPFEYGEIGSDFSEPPTSSRQIWKQDDGSRYQ